jgi:hypothetical protein
MFAYNDGPVSKMYVYIYIKIRVCPNDPRPSNTGVIGSYSEDKCMILQGQMTILHGSQ